MFITYMKTVSYIFKRKLEAYSMFAPFPTQKLTFIK